MKPTYLKKFFKQFAILVKSPIFLTLTVVGNSLVFLFSFAFYLIERNINPQVEEFIDALWWGFATITTVGYGDITPITMTGQIVGIMAMLLGTALFATYTALFARAILSSETFNIKKIEIREKQSHESIEDLKERIKHLEDIIEKSKK